MRIPFTKWEVRARPAERPSAWNDFWYGVQPYDNASGIDVDEDTALTYSTVYACVRVIAEDLASLPLHVYRRNGDTKERAPRHPLYSLLHDAPNPEMSAMQFREAMQAHLLTFGNCYAEIQRNLRGWPVGLWPLNPVKMEVVRGESDELIYKYQIDSNEYRKFSADEILHVAGLGYNGLIGYSPISYHREVIGSGLAERALQATNSKSGNRLQLAFIHPAGVRPPSPDGRKALREEMRREYAGPEGNRIGVFFEGMEPKPISMTMEDAQFIESRKFTRNEICSIYRVPPHKVMDLERATFSNIESQAIEYVIDTLRPWAIRWEQAINSKLLAGTNFFSEHLVDGLLRGDIKSRYDAYAVGRQWGWLSINDIRRMENMNPVDKGNDYLQPMNMVPLGTPPQEKPTAPDAEEVEEAERKIRLIKGK